MGLIVVCMEFLELIGALATLEGTWQPNSYLSGSEMDCFLAVRSRGNIVTRVCQVSK